MAIQTKIQDNYEFNAIVKSIEVDLKTRKCTLEIDVETGHKMTVAVKNENIILDLFGQYNICNEKVLIDLEGTWLVNPKNDKGVGIEVINVEGDEEADKNYRKKMKMDEYADVGSTPYYYIIKDNYDVHALEIDLAEGVLNNLSMPEYHYFCNALEYLIRFKNKNGVQDLDKAISEIELLRSVNDGI